MNQYIRIDAPTNIQLNLSKNRKVDQKLDFDPENK